MVYTPYHLRGIVMWRTHFFFSCRRRHTRSIRDWSSDVCSSDLFGAIVGDRTEIGCNAVINPGSVIGRDCMIYPGVNFRGFLSHGSMLKLRQELQVIEKREIDRKSVV